MRIVKRHPLCNAEVIEVAPNRAVIEYLHQYDVHTDLEVDIRLNGGEKLGERDYKRTLKEGDILTLEYRPAGIIEASTFITGAVVSEAFKLLIPIPEFPNSVGTVSTSPNNSVSSVSSQTNSVRKYEALPNIYGRVWSVPDLIANGVPSWVSNRKQVRETFVVGEGFYRVDEIRQGSTNIDEISESIATVYDPYTYPSNLYSVKLSDEVDDEDLLAPNDESLIWTGRAQILAGQTPPVYAQSGTTVTFTAPDTLIFDLNTTVSDEYGGLVIEDGDSLTILNTALNNGAKTVNTVSITTDTLTVTFNETIVTEAIASWEEDDILASVQRTTVYADSDATIISDLGIVYGDDMTTNLMTPDFVVGGYRVLSDDSDTYIYMSAADGLLASGSFNDNATLQVSTADDPNIIGPFTMSTTAEEIWFNITAKNGLQSSSGSEISIVITFYAQEIDGNGDDVGSPISQSVTLSGDSYSQVGQTVKMTDMGEKKYKVYGIRETGTFSGAAQQAVVWEEVFTVNSYSGENFGNVTVIDATTKASLSGTTSSRNINADVTRILDGVATTNFADAVVDLIVNKGGRPESEIDMDGLYEIADSLSDELKEFSFTFDDKNISLAQAVQTACNVARVNVYRDGQTWRFNRDEPKVRTYMFNRRNLASGDNQSFTLSAFLPNDYDSVALRYYDRDIESFDDVLVRIDSDAENFVVGEDGERPFEMEMAGCSNYIQALNRANLEARKIVYQRRQVTDVALSDASSVDIGDRVSWCDIYDGETMDGEIVGQDGSTFYTSEELVIEDGITYYAMITDQDGQAMTPVEVTAISGQKYFTATLAGDVLIADNYLVQAGSKYIIGSIDDIDDTDYSVIARGGNSNGRVSIELVQYNESIYEAD